VFEKRSYVQASGTDQSGKLAVFNGWKPSGKMAFGNRTGPAGIVNGAPRHQAGRA